MELVSWTVSYEDLFSAEDTQGFRLPIEMPEGYEYWVEKFTLIDSAQIKFGSEFNINKLNINEIQNVRSHLNTRGRCFASIAVDSHHHSHEKYSW